MKLNLKGTVQVVGLNITATCLAGSMTRKMTGSLAMNKVTDATREAATAVAK